MSPVLTHENTQRYGCTGWTDDVLSTLLELAESRGIVEIGAGNGQWARALSDFYTENSQNRVLAAAGSNFDFVLAYDDMTELPLSPQVYHKHTQPASDYFYAKVQKSQNVTNVLRQWSCRGRVLLLVYPPPTPMALETIQAYVSMGPENDTVVYVGEGRGGSTANDDLFDYLEDNGWILLEVMKVQSQPGGKGYEKMYILRRPPSGKFTVFFFL